MAKRKLKVKPQLELVLTCDHCHGKLTRTCVRTNGSAACAAGDGVVVKYYYGGDIRYYCCKECSDAE